MFPLAEEIKSQLKKKYIEEEQKWQAEEVCFALGNIQLREYTSVVPAMKGQPWDQSSVPTMQMACHDKYSIFC